jgi:hypothetical protein
MTLRGGNPLLTHKVTLKVIPHGEIICLLCTKYHTLRGNTNLIGRSGILRATFVQSAREQSVQATILKRTRRARHFFKVACTLCTLCTKFSATKKSGVHALYALHGLHQVYAVVCPPGTCRVLPHGCRSGPPRRRAPSGIIPTHICDNGSRCGCCVLRSIWSVSPAEPSSSPTSSRTFGCATSHSSEL